MFDIQSVILENFMSYRGRHEFAFPAEPGLYSLTGINKLQPRLTSNDCGKTTLLGAIRWCLYGSTARSLRAGDIINWDENSAEVSVRLLINDKQRHIRRRQAPNSLTLDGTVVSQETLEKELRISPKQFDLAVMLPQFGDAFFDQSPTEKLNLISDIMNLDYWLERSDAAGKLAKGLLDDRAAKERLILQAEAKIETCNQDIADYKYQSGLFADEKYRAVKALKKKLIETDKNISRLKLSLKQNQSALEKARLKLESISAVCPTCKQPVKSDTTDVLRQNIRDFVNDTSRTERSLSAALAEKEAQEANIEEEKKRESPYAKLAEAKKLTIGKLERELGAHKKELDTINADHASVDFWVGGFKRVRLYVVETALRQLEIEVNNNLIGLGLADWQIKLDVERETKSGTISKGFTVFIYPPGRAEPVRWEAFGGGATQRLRLAGNLGLANLILERAGLRSQIEVYDEPSNHMSTQGMDDLLVTLHERARAEGKKIWVVDHHSLDYAFDGRLLVTKDEKGSHLTF